MVTTAPAHPIDVPSSAVDAYRRSGFVRGPRLLDSVELDHLKQEVLRVIDERDGDGPQPVHVHTMGVGERPVWQIVNIWQASPAFKRLVTDSRLAAWAAALTGASELRLWHDQIQYKPASTGGETAWHQDGVYWPSIVPADSMISAWIALDDAEPDNGCMSMVPGSHRWGSALDTLKESRGRFESLPDQYQGHDVHPVACPVPAGCVHFHHSLTWHGSPENHSGRPRRALAVHFATERTRVHADSKHTMHQFITSGDGEPLAGAPFLQVWG